MLEGKTPMTASQVRISHDGQPQIIYKEVIVEKTVNGEVVANSEELQN